MEQGNERVERPWTFALGEAVILEGGAEGEVTWRRESAGGDRDYLVRTEAGESWHPENTLQAK